MELEPSETVEELTMPELVVFDQSDQVRLVGDDVEPEAAAEMLSHGWTLPIVEPHWLDERETCPLLQACLDVMRSQGDCNVPNFEACLSFREGECRRCPGAACAFLEDPQTSAVWRKARQFRRVDGGLLYVGARGEVEIAYVVSAFEAGRVKNGAMSA